MGTFRVDGLLTHIVDRHRTANVAGMLVDTGSEYTWVPAKILETLGVEREKKDLTFVMANGRQITRSVGFAIVHIEGNFTIDEVVFAQDGDLSLLGARSLEGLNLTVDSRLKKLVASGPLPAASVGTGMRRVDLLGVIKSALAKEGWTVTHDPYLPPPLVPGDLEPIPVDRVISADRAGKKVAGIPLEIADPSDLDPIDTAIGGHALSQSLMVRSDPDRIVRLAVTKEGASMVLSRPSVSQAIDDLRLPFLVCDRETQSLLRWGLHPDGVH